MGSGTNNSAAVRKLILRERQSKTQLFCLALFRTFLVSAGSIYFVLYVALQPNLELNTTMKNAILADGMGRAIGY